MVMAGLFWILTIQLFKFWKVNGKMINLMDSVGFYYPMEIIIKVSSSTGKKVAMENISGQMGIHILENGKTIWNKVMEHLDKQSNHWYMKDNFTKENLWYNHMNKEY